MNTTKNGYLYAMAAVLIWSGFILVSRLGGISELLPNDVIAIRYATCAAILLPIWWFKYRFKLLDMRLIICSLVGGLAYAICTFRGFQLAPASHAAVLLPGLMPLFIAVLAFAINKEQHPIIKWIGIGIITLGVGALFWQQFAENNSFSMGHIWLVGGAMCWAIFTVLIKRWEITPWQVTVSLAVITCIIYLPIYLLWLPKNIHAASFSDIAVQAFYQGIMATIVQMIFYVRAVQILGASTMGSMMAIVPILSGLMAVALFGEPLSTGLVLGLICVSVGSWLAHSQWFGKRNHKTLISQTK